MSSFEDVLNTFSETFCTTTTEFERMQIMFKAGMLRAAEALCKNCEAEGLNVRCDLCTDVAAIREEVNSGN